MISTCSFQWSHHGHIPLSDGENCRNKYIVTDTVLLNISTDVDHFLSLLMRSSVPDETKLECYTFPQEMTSEKIRLL